MELTKERMYQAIVEKDTSFEGVFFTAVKTTGIFLQTDMHCKETEV